MKLLLPTSATNEFYDGCPYAFVDLTPEDTRKILQRFEVFQALQKADNSLTEMEYYDCSPIYLAGLPDTLDGLLDSGQDFARVQCAAEDFENFAERTECDRMVISDRNVYWKTIPKHSDVRVETRPVDYLTLRLLLEEVTQ